MLANANGQISVIFLILLAATVLAISGGLWDLIRRPRLVFRVARVTKIGWILLLGISMAGIIASLVVSLYAAPANRIWDFAILGSAPCVVGLIGGAWYLAIVRPWVAAQVSFARQ
jgi:hypothetical protein